MFKKIRYIFLPEQFNQSFFSLGFLIFLFSTAIGAIYYYLPLFFSRIIGEMYIIGIFIALSFTWYLLIDIFLGTIISMPGYKTLFKLSLLSLIIFISIHTLYSGLWTTVAALAFVAFSVETFMIAVFQYITQNVKKDSFSTVFSNIAFFTSAGYVAGPIITAAIINKSFYLVFDFIGIVALLTILVFFKKIEPSQDFFPAKFSKKKTLKIEWHILKYLAVKYFPIFMAFLILGMFRGIIWFISPLFALDVLHMGAAAGFLMGAFSLPQLFLHKYARKINKIIPNETIITYSFFTSALLFFFFSKLHSLAAILLLAFSAAAFINIAYPAITTLVENYIEKNSNTSDEYISGQLFTQNSGYIIGSIITGFSLKTSYNLTTPFTVLSFFLLFSSLIFILFYGYKKTLLFAN